MTSLPPHSPEAERALLGCILLDASVLAEVRGRVGMTDGVFYGADTSRIWAAMCGLHQAGRAIDVVSVVERLRDAGNLDTVGGMTALSGLSDLAANSGMWPEYFRIVWEKHVARAGIRVAATWAERFHATGSVSESMLAQLTQDVEFLQKAGAAILSERPRNLAEPIDFEQGYMDAWLRRHQEDYGYTLPIEFPMRIRPSELTVFTGESGAGKSSFLGQTSIVLGLQGAKLLIASMEVPPEITLWILARQLLARRTITDDEEGRGEAIAALAWLQRHVWLYNFVGITDWRELMATCEYARKHHAVNVVIVDSVMRIGIADDDYALQGLVATRFANLATTSGLHIVLVHHQNKAAESKMKSRVRGSAQWTDNAHNVCGIIRNEAKDEKLAELKEQRRIEQGKVPATPKEEEDRKAELMTITQKENDLRTKWDAKFVMSKQRWPGAPQNGSRFLFFDHECLQFMEHHDDKPYRYLPEDKRRKHDASEPDLPVV